MLNKKIKVQITERGLIESYDDESGLFIESGNLNIKTGGISGSLTTLSDGSPYLIAGSGIVLSTGSSGAVTIASTGGSNKSTAITYDATPTVIVSSATSTDIAVTYEAKVTAKKVGMPSAVSYGLVGTFVNSGGTLTQVGSTTRLWTHESAGETALDANFGVAGTSVQLSVTGSGPQQMIGASTPPVATGNTWTVGTLGGENFADLATALASPSVINGDRLLLSAQSFTVASTVTVSKQVVIQGAGKNSTIIQTNADGSAPQLVIQVTSNNVVIRDLTVKQRRTVINQFGIEFGTGAGSTGHYLESVRIETVNIGVSIKSDGWQINNCELYCTGTGTGYLCIIYHSNGQGLFINNLLGQGSATTTRGIYASVSSPNTLGSYLRISNNRLLSGETGVYQFMNCDSFNNSATPLTLVVDNNNVNEGSAFVVFVMNKANLLNYFESISIFSNTISGNHGGSPVGTKGAFAIDGSGTGNLAPGNTKFVAFGNTISNTTFRTGWASAMSSVYTDPTVLALMGYEPGSPGPYQKPNETVDIWSWSATMSQT